MRPIHCLFSLVLIAPFAASADTTNDEDAYDLEWLSEEPKESPAPPKPAKPQQAVAQPEPVSKKEPTIFKYRECPEEAAFLASGDYLLWKPFIDETDYVTKGTQPPIPEGEDQGPHGKYKHADFDWASGFRVGLGYCFKPYFWSLEAAYTHFSSSGRNQETAKTTHPPSLNGTFSQPVGRLETATSHIQLHYQVGDAFIARRFLPTDYMILKMPFGVTGADIHESWNVDYFGTTGHAFIKNSWKFKGIGFRTGLGADWFFGKGFGLSSKATIATFFGNYHNKVKQTNFIGFTEIIVNPQADASKSGQRFIPQLQFAFGPSWGISGKSVGFQLSAFYELNMWFNLQELLLSQLQSSNFAGKDVRRLYGNVGLQGLTVNAELHF